LLIVSALCFNEWATIHYLAGIMTVYFSWTGDVGSAMSGIASATGISYSSYDYPVHTSRLAIQHGINLWVAGLFAHLTIVAMVLNWEAAPVIALLPFLIDVGYFVGFDLPLLGAAIGQAQTYIVSTGIICLSIFTYL
jgi:hypothetical protein